MESVTLYPISNLPFIHSGDNMPSILFEHIRESPGIHENDVIVVAQKIVSKAEGAVVDLSTVVPWQYITESDCSR